MSGIIRTLSIVLLAQIALASYLQFSRTSLSAPQSKTPLLAANLTDPDQITIRDSDNNSVVGTLNTLTDVSTDNQVAGAVNTLDDSNGNTVAGAGNTLENFSNANTVSGFDNQLNDSLSNTVSGNSNSISSPP